MLPPTHSQVLSPKWPPRNDFFDLYRQNWLFQVTKMDKKWWLTAWWTSCQEPSPRARNREIEKSRGVKTGWNQNESKMNQKHRKWMVNPKKVMFFPTENQQKREWIERWIRKRRTEKKNTNQPQGLPLHLHRHCHLHYLAWASIPLIDCFVYWILNGSEGNKDEWILFESNDSGTVSSWFTRALAHPTPHRGPTIWKEKSLAMPCHDPPLPWVQWLAFAPAGSFKEGLESWIISQPFFL